MRLYTTPTAFLSSITVDTDFKDTLGLVKIEATIAAMEGVDESDLYVEYSLYDADDSKVATARGQSLFKVMLNISDVNLWWPFGMNPSPGYLYTLKVHFHSFLFLTNALVFCFYVVLFCTYLKGGVGMVGEA